VQMPHRRYLMDKQGVGMDMWTSPQNARLDHMPTPPTRAYPQGSAYGLTRFACQQPFEIEDRKTEYRGNAVQLHVKPR